MADRGVAALRRTVRDRTANRVALWTLLWRGAGPRVIVVAGLSVLQGLAPVGAVLASGLLLGALSEPGGPESGAVAFGLGLFGAVLLLGALLSALNDAQVAMLDGRYGRAVHRTVARATLGTPGIAALEDPRVAGEIAALAEFERADGFLSTGTSLRELLQQRATGVGAFVVLFGFSWWAPLVLLVGWRGLSIGIGRWLGQGMAVAATVGATEIGRSRYLRGLAVEPPAAKEVRIFGLADWLVGRYATTYLAALRSIWANRRLGMRAVLAATSGVLAAHALVLGVLADRALAGTVSVAELTVFVQAVLATTALGYVFGAEVPLARARQVARQVLRLERDLAVGTPDRPDPGPSGPLSVLVRDLWFSYPGGSRPVLAGLDLAVPAGQSVAVVGVNGAGKSTLIKLLCGLYEPDLGRIELGGAAPARLRGRLAVIFQNFVRYPLPLRANVAFGSLPLTADEAALTGALTAAGAAGLAADLPAGMDTVLTAAAPGGRDLSGGQWQKVALARALAAVHGGAGLLVLDEPAASLDVRAEAELFDRLLAATRGVTTILVSHRLAAVRRADRIVVLAGGRIVEDGSHEDLMAVEGGRYAAMYRLQAARFRPVAAPAAEPVGGVRIDG